MQDLIPLPDRALPYFCHFIQAKRDTEFSIKYFMDTGLRNLKVIYDRYDEGNGITVTLIKKAGYLCKTLP